MLLISDNKDFFLITTHDFSLMTDCGTRHLHILEVRKTDIAIVVGIPKRNCNLARVVVDPVRYQLCLTAGCPNATYSYIFEEIGLKCADRGARAFSGVGLRPPAGWDCGFDSHRGHGYLSVVSVVCCQVEEVSAKDRSLVQRSRAECGACNLV